MSISETNEVVRNVMSAVCKNLLETGKTYDDLVKLVFGIRLCISSGYGDFGITSIVC